MAKLCLVQDWGSDWYVIPVERRDEWNDAIENEDTQMAEGEYPDWAEYISSVYSISFDAYEGG